MAGLALRSGTPTIANTHAHHPLTSHHHQQALERLVCGKSRLGFHALHTSNPCKQAITSAHIPMIHTANHRSWSGWCAATPGWT